MKLSTQEDLEKVKNNTLNIFYFKTYYVNLLKIFAVNGKNFQ